MRVELFVNPSAQLSNQSVSRKRDADIVLEEGREVRGQAYEWYWTGHLGGAFDLEEEDDPDQETYQ